MAPCTYMALCVRGGSWAWGCRQQLLLPYLSAVKHSARVGSSAAPEWLWPFCVCCLQCCRASRMHFIMSCQRILRDTLMPSCLSCGSMLADSFDCCDILHAVYIYPVAQSKQTVCSLGSECISLSVGNPSEIQSIGWLFGTGQRHLCCY